MYSLMSSYINPFNSEYQHAIQQKFPLLSGKQQLFISITSVVVGLLTLGIGGFVAFRSLTERLVSKIETKHTTLAVQKINHFSVSKLVSQNSSPQTVHSQHTISKQQTASFPPSLSQTSDQANHLQSDFSNISPAIAKNNEKQSLVRAHSKPRRLCEHEGNSCFMNTMLQLTAHFRFYDSLFDPFNNPIMQQTGESNDHFENRKKVQRLGKILLTQIQNGTVAKVKGIRNFLHAIEKCGVMEPGKSVDTYLRDGGDITIALTWAFKILRPDTTENQFMPVVYSTTLTDLPVSINANDSEFDKKAKQNFIQKHKQKQIEISNSYCFKLKDVQVNGNDKTSTNPIAEELTINGVKFVLEAVVIGGTGHTYPYIRSEQGFIKYDDISSGPEVFKDLASTGIKRWFSLYYVKK